MSDDALGKKLEEAAIMLADQILKGSELVKDTTDAFKAVSSYYAATRKLNAKAGASEDEGTNFDGFRRRIASASKGSAPTSGPDRANGTGSASTPEDTGIT